MLRKRTNENFDVLLWSSIIGLELWLSRVGDKAQMMGIRGSCGGVSVFAGIFWRSLAVSGSLWQAPADCGSRRTPSYLWMHHGWPHSFDCCFAADGAKPDQASPASTQGCSPGSAWHAVIIRIRNFSPSPSHPPSLRPAGIPTGHGGYAPGCCVVCGACKSKPTGILRRDTLDISNPSRLREIPPATKNSPLESKPRFRTGTPKDRRCSPHHITHVRYVRKV
jgi:hypothetical protein